MIKNINYNHLKDKLDKYKYFLALREKVKNVDNDILTYDQKLIISNNELYSYYINNGWDKKESIQSFIKYKQYLILQYN